MTNGQGKPNTPYYWLNQISLPEQHLAVKPPTNYVVHKLFAVPSVNIVYGAPAAMKTMLMADMLVCVALGKTWLEAGVAGDKRIVEFPTRMARGLLVDFDNGRVRTEKRLEALEREHGLDPNSLLLGSISVPDPPWTAADYRHTNSLGYFLNSEGYELVVFDNLIAISGGLDENSSKIMDVLHNLRRMSEIAQAALVILHHSRKEMGFKGGMGDSLRGFSGIRGAVDTALEVEREGLSGSIVVRPGKVRDTAFKTFAASFWYTHKKGVDQFGMPLEDMERARFFGDVPPMGNTDEDIKHVIIEHLTSIKPNRASVTEITTEVQTIIKGSGVNKIRHLLEVLWADGLIKKNIGQHNKKEYYIQ